MATDAQRPPQYTAKELTQLMRFYRVSTIFDLIASQEAHISKLQERLKENNILPRQFVTSRVREG